MLFNRSLSFQSENFNFYSQQVQTHRTHNKTAGESQMIVQLIMLHLMRREYVVTANA
jgi:hypothetical protein